MGVVQINGCECIDSNTLQISDCCCGLCISVRRWCREKHSTVSKTDENKDVVKETEKGNDESVCLEKSREDNVTGNLGRKRIRMEFGNPRCQILQREQRPVAFGLVVSFLSSLLPRKDGDKKRGVMEYISPPQPLL